jgi:hypothetical protein
MERDFLAPRRNTMRKLLILVAMVAILAACAKDPADFSNLSLPAMDIECAIGNLQKDAREFGRTRDMNGADKYHCEQLRSMIWGDPKAWAEVQAYRKASGEDPFDPAVLDAAIDLMQAQFEANYRNR